MFTYLLSIATFFQITLSVCVLQSWKLTWFITWPKLFGTPIFRYLSVCLYVNYICISCFVKNGIRRQLRVSGMSRKVYWLSYLISHLLMFVLPLIILIICIFAFNIKSLKMKASLILVIVACILHLLGNLLFVYTFSFIFGKITTILNFVSLFCNINYI